MDVSNDSPLIVFLLPPYHHLFSRKQPFPINQIDEVAWKSGHTSQFNKLANHRFNLNIRLITMSWFHMTLKKYRISLLIIWANIKIVENGEDNIFWKLKGWRKNMGMTFRSMHVIWVIDCINKVTHLKFNSKSKTFMHLFDVTIEQIPY